MFSHPSRFYEICAKIESDANFRSGCDSEINIELLALAKDKKNSSNYPAKPTAIQPLTLGLKTLRPNRLYQIKTAMFADQDGDEISVWHIDTTKVILVNKEGNATIHWRQHIEMGDFTKPIIDSNLDVYLANKNPPQPSCRKR